MTHRYCRVIDISQGLILIFLQEICFNNTHLQGVLTKLINFEKWVFFEIFIKQVKFHLRFVRRLLSSHPQGWSLALNVFIIFSLLSQIWLVLGIFRKMLVWFRGQLFVGAPCIFVFVINLYLYVYNFPQFLVFLCNICSTKLEFQVSYFKLIL